MATRFSFTINLAISRAFLPNIPEVGDVTVREDYGELIVFIGTITHGHFGSYEDNLSEPQHAAVVAEALVDFLTDLFADKYFLHKSKWSGGWTHVDMIEESDIKSQNVRWFKWSGPIKSASPRETNA